MTAGPAPDSYDLRRTERVIAEDDRTAELGVRLSLSGGRIFVRGAVSSDAQRDRIVALVRQTYPQLPVVDELACTEESLATAPGAAEELG